MTAITRRNANETYAPEMFWNKYAAASRPGWTWEPVARQQFRPFSTVGEKLILTMCGSIMIVLIAIMA